MNDVQKNFRKQMDKGLKKLKKENKDTYYDYLRKNHLHNPEVEEKNKGVGNSILSGLRKLLSTICILVIIIVSLALISSIISSLNKRNISNQDGSISNNNINVNSIAVSQQSIVNFINQLNPIENNIISDVNLRTNDVNSFNSKTLTAREFMDNLIVYKTRIENNITKMDNLNYPKELQDYQTEVKKTYKALTIGMESEIKYFQTKNTSELSKSKNEFNIFNESMKSKNAMLINILDQYKIKHQ